jgi:hypothetical protein
MMGSTPHSLSEFVCEVKENKDIGSWEMERDSRRAALKKLADGF